MYYYWAVGCSVGWAVGCCRRIRSKLLCTFYVHLATCKMGRKTRRNDSYIHSGKKRGTFYRTRPTAFTTTQMKQFELSLTRIYNLSQDFKKSQEMRKTAKTWSYNWFSEKKGNLLPHTTNSIHHHTNEAI